MGIGISAVTHPAPMREFKLQSFEGNIDGFIKNGFSLAADETQEIWIGSCDDLPSQFKVTNLLSIRRAAGVEFDLILTYKDDIGEITTMFSTPLVLNGGPKMVSVDCALPDGAVSLEVSIVAYNPTGRTMEDAQIRLHEPTTIREI